MVRVGKACRRLPVQSRGSVQADFLNKLIGLVVELSSPVLGVRGSTPASSHYHLLYLYNEDTNERDVIFFES